MRGARMLVRSSVLVVMAAVGSGMICHTPPPPPPPAPPVTGTGGTFTVTVTTVGPDIWSYTVTTTGASNINNVQLVAPIDPNDCTTTAVTGGWTAAVAGGVTVLTTATPTTTVSFSVDCDKTNGPVNLIISDVGGASSVVGPVAGPT